MVSVGLLSKGGLAGLTVALAVFVGRRLWDVPRYRLAGAVTAPVAALGAAWLLRGALTAPNDPWGVQVKLDGMKDVLPLAMDHFGFGIGRGAFVSVYPQYKTSPLQLTFAFPENLVAQFVGEWGVIVGLAAVISLLIAVGLRLGAREPGQSRRGGGGDGGGRPKSGRFQPRARGDGGSRGVDPGRDPAEAAASSRSNWRGSC